MMMHKPLLAAVLASSVALSACATHTAGDAARGAAYGAAAGTAAGAIIAGFGIIEGAAIGSAICGLGGDVLDDRTGDGRVDGYVYQGQYYPGAPQGWDPTLQRVATGALGGAALGAGAGAIIPGLGILEGAVIGAAVGGLAGAVWADRTGDGRVDGYVYQGQYYPGAPPQAQPAYQAPVRRGERG
jgi:hypothetical protein